jgi:hypothetical protein
VWEYPVVDPVDPEERVAELERQLREARTAAWRVESSGATGVSFPSSPARESYSPFGPDGTALATAPRRVPIGFLLAEFLPFRWWYLFAMFMVAIPPIIVWVMQPALFLPAAVIVLLAIYGIQFERSRARIALLKWGQVATVTGAEVLSQGTYYGGVTYSNVVLPVARGWTVTRSLWSGPKTTTRIRYQLDGYRGRSPSAAASTSTASSSPTSANPNAHFACRPIPTTSTATTPATGPGDFVFVCGSGWRAGCSS